MTHQCDRCEAWVTTKKISDCCSESRGRFVCLCGDKKWFQFQCITDYQIYYFRIKGGCECTYSVTKWNEVSKKYRYKTSRNWMKDGQKNAISEMKKSK